MNVDETLVVSKTVIGLSTCKVSSNPAIVGVVAYTLQLLQHYFRLLGVVTPVYDCGLWVRGHRPDQRSQPLHSSYQNRLPEHGGSTSSFIDMLLGN